MIPKKKSDKPGHIPEETTQVNNTDEKLTESDNDMVWVLKKKSVQLLVHMNYLKWWPSQNEHCAAEMITPHDHGLKEVKSKLFSLIHFQHLPFKLSVQSCPFTTLFVITTHPWLQKCRFMFTLFSAFEYPKDFYVQY